MTSRYQNQGDGGNDPGWMGARHIYPNYDDSRLLFLIPGYLQCFISFFCMTLISQGQGHGSIFIHII